MASETYQCKKCECFVAKGTKQCPNCGSRKIKTIIIDQFTNDTPAEKLVKRGFFERLFGKGEDSPQIIKSETIQDKSKSREYSLLQLSAPIFMNTPSSSDDDELFKQAYSLMQNKRWGEARKIIQDGLQTCKRKDRLCDLIANIYHIEKNPLAIGWYMQSCVLGSPSWVPYLLVSYAARALGLDDIAWRCLNACDVIETGMKRIDKLETDIADLVKNFDQSQLLVAMKNFEKAMCPYLPSSDELPHDQVKRSIFLGQNITGDPEMAPLKQQVRLLKRS